MHARPHLLWKLYVFDFPFDNRDDVLKPVTLNQRARVVRHIAGVHPVHFASTRASCKEAEDACAAANIAYHLPIELRRVG